jgi:hypothetical protein
MEKGLATSSKTFSRWRSITIDGVSEKGGRFELSLGGIYFLGIKV